VYTDVEESHRKTILVTANSDNYKNKWSRPTIHIVSTRFMQNQGSLVHLGRARLALFKAVCLPTVLGQTVMPKGEEVYDPAFLWIIKIDPELDYSLRYEMIELLQPYSNFYLVGSNDNVGFGDGGGNWRGGEVGEKLMQLINDGMLYTGDLATLRRAYHFREDRVVLETRLDADDGLNVNYLETIQSNANTTFSGFSTDGKKKKKAKWKYWCAQNNLDWYPALSATWGNNNYGDIGSLVPIQSPHFCITPGLTLGFGIGTVGKSVPQYPHDKIVEIVKQTGGCGLAYKSCFQMIDNPEISAIRSRTPTSAGMKDMAPTKKKMENLMRMAAEFDADGTIIKRLGQMFGINEDTIQHTTTHIRDNLLFMSEDNLRGQCTKGHSCKVESKEALQQIVDLAGNGRVNGAETVKITVE